MLVRHRTPRRACGRAQGPYPLLSPYMPSAHRLHDSSRVSASQSNTGRHRVRPVSPPRAARIAGRRDGLRWTPRLLQLQRRLQAQRLGGDAAAAAVRAEAQRTQSVSRTLGPHPPTNSLESCTQRESRWRQALSGSDLEAVTATCRRRHGRTRDLVTAGGGCAPLRMRAAKRTKPLALVLALVVTALRSHHTHVHAHSASPPPPPPPEPPWSPLVFAPPRPPEAQSGEVELLQNDRLNMPMSAELQIRNEGVPWYENRFKEVFDRRYVDVTLGPHGLLMNDTGTLYDVSGVLAVGCTPPHTLPCVHCGVWLQHSPLLSAYTKASKRKLPTPFVDPLRRGNICRMCNLQWPRQNREGAYVKGGRQKGSDPHYRRGDPFVPAIGAPAACTKVRQIRTYCPSLSPSACVCVSLQSAGPRQQPRCARSNSALE